LAQLQVRTHAYGVALVVNSDQARVSWHLQRDLQAVLGWLDQGASWARTPLGHYLTGHADPGAEATLWGRWRRIDLTDSQRAAAELAMGSKLCAVQGPPGTGKTTVILNLLAHALVNKVATLAQGGSMGPEIMVVSSTNNRAVDNVVDPLGRDFDESALPLSLRVGSRQIVEKVTSLGLERVRGWLETRSMPAERAHAQLESELRLFRQLRARLKDRVDPEQTYRERLARRRQVGVDIEQLRAEFAPARECEALQTALRRLGVTLPAGLTEASSAAGDENELDRWAEKAARNALVAAALSALGARLARLSQLAEGSGQAALVKLQRYWKRTEQGSHRG
jgi:hypothetical protein